jgi:hypothetical protein
MKVPFAQVRMYFPDTDSVSPGELYHSIGYPENIGNPNFLNTCAIRLSLALLGAGFPNPGMWPIKAGKYKGRMIETKQRKLSAFLVRQLGQPEKFKSGQDAEGKIGARRGIVSFFQHLWRRKPARTHCHSRERSLGQVHALRERNRRDRDRVLLVFARRLVLAARVVGPAGRHPVNSRAARPLQPVGLNDLMLRYVTIFKFSVESGYTENAIRSKIRD